MFHNLLQSQKGSWGFTIMMKASKKTVSIYIMVIKKKELADVILVNICFRTLLISLLIFVFVFKINLSLCLSWVYLVGLLWEEKDQVNMESFEALVFLSSMIWLLGTCLKSWYQRCRGAWIRRRLSNYDNLSYKFQFEKTLHCFSDIENSSSQKSRQNLKSTLLSTPIIPDLRFLCETDVPAKILNLGFVKMGK